MLQLGINRGGMEQGAGADAAKFIRPEFEKLIDRKKHRHFLFCSRGRRPRQRPGDRGQSRLLVPINKIVLPQNTVAQCSALAKAELSVTIRYCRLRPTLCRLCRSRLCPRRYITV